MIIEIGNRIMLKCDECGKFIKHNEQSVNFIPDTPFGPERLEVYHSACSPIVKEWQAEVEQIIKEQLNP